MEYRLADSKAANDQLDADKHEAHDKWQRLVPLRAVGSQKISERPPHRNMLAQRLSQGHTDRTK